MTVMRTPALVLCLIVTGSVFAQASAAPPNAPATGAASATTRPADQTLSSAATRPADTQPALPPLDPKVEAILDRLEKKKVDDIETKIVYVKEDPVLESKQQFIGILRFQRDEPNPRFFIRFDKMIHDGIVKKKGDQFLREWHVFDGIWYIEARDKTETIIKRQIVREGERFDAFRVGKGPFPMPFGQKKEDIARQFTIVLVEPDPERDPKNCDHLACTPLPDTELDRKYGRVHFFIDRKTDLPVKVETVEKDEGIIISATFTDVKVNEGLPTGSLDLPDLPGWNVSEEPLPPPAPPISIVPENEAPK